jgi:predicted GNAT family N-acyltransferase
MATPDQVSIVVRRVESDADYNHVFDIRTQVFVEEQAISQEDEYDGFDHLANHYLALYEGEPAGTSRWRMTPAGRIRLERFAVKDAFRGKGIGKALLLGMLNEAPKDREVFLHAQEFMTSYYEKMGFEASGEAFEEAGILHRQMVYKHE